MVYPYDYVGSLAFSNVDACATRGFAFSTSAQSIRGIPGASLESDAIVVTRAETNSADIDAFGRSLRIKYLGDTARTDDDVCVDTTYATPIGSNERILTAPSARTVSDCGTTVYAKETWQYDDLSPGQVSLGLPTSRSVERHDDAGGLLGTIREFDVSFNDSGDPVTVTRTREDKAARTVTITYDAFGLVPVTMVTTSSALPAMQTDIIRDPLTLNVTATREPNLTIRSNTYDGFQRQVLAMITPPGGTAGALSVTSFAGFTGSDPAGRRITQTMFTDPVDPATVGTAVGRTATVHLDELGREAFTELALGVDYGGKTLFAGVRIYDSVGRVKFEADPYPSDQDGLTAYGTTRYFNADGTPSCFIRGNGLQPFVPSPGTAVVKTNETSEIYPTCFSRTFQNHTEVVSVRDAASLLDQSPQQDVVKTSYLTATGRLSARATWQGSNRVEYAAFSHDRLGHMASMTRYQDAAAGANPVTTTWHTDSLGQLLELDEPDSVQQLRSYSNWGELLETSRTVAGVLKREMQSYDALGRMTHREQRTGSVVDPETVYDYAYDTGVEFAPQVTPTNVLGRLTQATSPSGAVTFSYDAFGRMNAQVFSDGQGGLFVEKHTLHGDGTMQYLDLYLPDTAFADERVTYTHDSAGRATSVTYANGATQSLFQASAVDAFGRVRQAQYGQTSYAATYADLGRRLLSQVSISSSQGSRSINLQNLDPVGRERGRIEVRNGDDAAGITTSYTYDALGRLTTTVQTKGRGTLLDQQFSYDSLGNVLGVANVGASNTNVTMTYEVGDRDRICTIAFGNDSPTECNVTYDEIGSITTQPTQSGARHYGYLVDGRVRTTGDGQGSTAHFRYDAFGEVQQLDLTSTISLDIRQDRHYG